MTMTEKEYEKKDVLTAYAYAKLKEHGLDNWQFIITYKQQRKMLGIRCSQNIGDVGTCNVGFRIITMPEEIIGEFKPTTLQDIFLHELAHAIAGRYNIGHNATFRRICKELGCKSYMATPNIYLLDMFGRYEVTRAENRKCCANYIKKHKK
jgi:hypothetical protein